MSQQTLIALAVTSGQRTTLVLDPLALPTGRTVADYSAFRLAVRKDPDWPRDRTQKFDELDPDGDGWDVSVTADGELNDDGEPEFTFDAPTSPGRYRYVYDVWGTLTTGGEVPLVRGYWLTVLPRVAAPV
jgi:hypothetical protein